MHTLHIDAVGQVGSSAAADRRLEALSEVERRRVKLARALVHKPELLLLDEPTAVGDIAGRESLLSTLSGLATDSAVRAIVLVTHHAEEIPPGFTHVALVPTGQFAGPARSNGCLPARPCRRYSGLPVELSQTKGR